MNSHLLSIVFCLALSFGQFLCATYNEKLLTNGTLTTNQLGQVCGIPSVSQSRIVGGNDAGNDANPWMAKLSAIYGSEAGSCAGVLISNQFVLTAAHCLSHPATLKLATVVAVYLGDLDSLYSKNGQSRTFTSKNIIPHPDYNANTFQNDIGLIELKQTVNFSNTMVPICLPVSSDMNSTYENMITMALGWGLLAEGGNASATLQQLRVQTVPNSQCEEVRVPLIDTQICSKDVKQASGTCDGDSGGPLTTRDKNDQENVIGVISYGSVCAKNPSIYTRVASYLPWIKEITGM